MPRFILTIVVLITSTLSSPVAAGTSITASDGVWLYEVMMLEPKIKVALLGLLSMLLVVAGVGSFRFFSTTHELTLVPIFVGYALVVYLAIEHTTAFSLMAFTVGNFMGVMLFMSNRRKFLPWFYMSAGALEVALAINLIVVLME